MKYKKVKLSYQKVQQKFIEQVNDQYNSIDKNKKKLSASENESLENLHAIISNLEEINELEVITDVYDKLSNIVNSLVTVLKADQDAEATRIAEELQNSLREISDLKTEITALRKKLRKYNEAKNKEKIAGLKQETSEDSLATQVKKHKDDVGNSKKSMLVRLIALINTDLVERRNQLLKKELKMRQSKSYIECNDRLEFVSFTPDGNKIEKKKLALGEKNYRFSGIIESFKKPSSWYQKEIMDIVIEQLLLNNKTCTYFEAMTSAKDKHTSRKYKVRSYKKIKNNFIFLALNTPGHWIGTIICKKEKKIFMFDSFGKGYDKSELINGILNTIPKNEKKAVRDELDTFNIIYSSHKIQKDGSSCGPLVLLFMLVFKNHADSLASTKSSIEFSKELKAKLLSDKDVKELGIIEKFPINKNNIYKLRLSHQIHAARFLHGIIKNLKIDMKSYPTLKLSQVEKAFNSKMKEHLYESEHEADSSISTDVSNHDDMELESETTNSTTDTDSQKKQTYLSKFKRNTAALEFELVKVNADIKRYEDKLKNPENGRKIDKVRNCIPCKKCIPCIGPYGIFISDNEGLAYKKISKLQKRKEKIENELIFGIGRLKFDTDVRNQLIKTWRKLAKLEKEKESKIRQVNAQYDIQRKVLIGGGYEDIGFQAFNENLNDHETKREAELTKIDKAYEPQIRKLRERFDNIYNAAISNEVEKEILTEKNKRTFLRPLKGRGIVYARVSVVLILAIAIDIAVTGRLVKANYDADNPVVAIWFEAVVFFLGLAGTAILGFFNNVYDIRKAEANYKGETIIENIGPKQMPKPN